MSCSRRKYSRWFLPTSDCTCDWILRAELEHLELLDQDPVERVHPRADVERVEDLLLDRRADGRQARGDEVGQLARLGDVGGERLQIVGQQRRQRHDLLEVALDVPLQRVDLEMILVAQALVGGRDGGPQVRPRLRRCRSRRTRASPWTIRRRLPSGSLNILWMWVAVPIGIEVVLQRLFDRRLALGEDPIIRPAVVASSIRRTEASRATASGMKELGNSTVSRSGSTGSSGGIDSGRSPAASRSSSS